MNTSPDTLTAPVQAAVPDFAAMKTAAETGSTIGALSRRALTIRTQGWACGRAWLAARRTQPVASKPLLGGIAFFPSAAHSVGLNVSIDAVLLAGASTLPLS